jgi:tetratricopeptide (TPR) repeat protein
MRYLVIAAICLLAGSCATKPGTDAESFFIRDTRAKPEANRKVVVFVHGVFGGSRSTWGAWPELMRRDSFFDGFDIYAVGYFTPMMSQAQNLEELAESFNQGEVVDVLLKSYDSIYIIAHSMGGLVAKGALIKLSLSNDKTRAQLRKIAAVMYISTPSSGAEIAEVGDWLSLNPQLKNMSASGANAFLQGLENNWSRVMQSRIEPQRVPRSFCAYETLRTFGVQIVPRLYSQATCDGVRRPLDFDHIDIVKVDSHGHRVYQWVKNRIEEVAAVHRFGRTKDDLKSAVKLNLRPYFWDVAMRDVEELIAHDADDPESHNMRAGILYNLSRYPAALEAVDRALALDKNYEAAQFNKAAILMRLDRHREAIPLLEARVRKQGNLGARSNLAECYLAVEKYDEAGRIFASVLEGEGAKAPASVHLGLGIVAFAGSPENHAEGVRQFESARCKNIKLSGLFFDKQIEEDNQGFGLYQKLLASLRAKGIPAFNTYLAEMPSRNPCI